MILLKNSNFTILISKPFFYLQLKCMMRDFYKIIVFLELA